MVARVERVLNKAASHAAPFWADVPAFTAFADEIRDSIHFGELTYANRKRLLRRADHHGIRRFDANLIMAMVQHRNGETKLVDEAEPRGTWMGPVTIALTVQAIIVLSVLVLIYA